MSGDRVVVYDTDGVNPYGRELAQLLADSGLRVTLITACDAAWAPQLRTRRLLPGNLRGHSRWRQAVRQLRGAWALFFLAAVRRRRVVVVWTRSTVEHLAIVASRPFRAKVVVVLHDPVDRGDAHPVARLLRRTAATCAWRRVAHSRDFARIFSRVLGRSAISCTFPPHTVWLGNMPGPAHRLPKSERLRMLMLGQVRADKGYEELPLILRAVDSDTRDRVELVLCGRGQVDPAVLASVGSLVTVEDRTSEEFVPDSEVKAAIFSSDVLLAPYVAPSQSSTIAMALAAGLGVIAYDRGALAELVDDAGLVQPGDRAAFAQRICDAARGSVVGAPRRDVSVWRIEAVEQWTSVVSGKR